MRPFALSTPRPYAVLITSAACPPSHLGRSPFLMRPFALSSPRPHALLLTSAVRPSSRGRVPSKQMPSGTSFPKSIVSKVVFFGAMNCIANNQK
uniref:Secreted protein n=1 Tax=Panagrellus redivivus TaxID=6233 RepID=A0A7E4VBR7_PANRE